MHRSEAEGRFGEAEPEGRASVCAEHILQSIGVPEKAASKRRRERHSISPRQKGRIFCAGLCQLRRLAKMAPLPLRLMLRAVEPINMLRSARILSVRLRPTPRTLGKPQETCLHSGFGAALQL